jgi:hypothetical protein
VERRELLAALPPEQAADALEEMQQAELLRLRESDTVDAARGCGRIASTTRIWPGWSSSMTTGGCSTT